MEQGRETPTYPGTAFVSWFGARMAADRLGIAALYCLLILELRTGPQ